MLLAALASFCSTTAAVAETAAGTAITNIASLQVAGGARPVMSNQVAVIAAERLDMTLGRAQPDAALLLTNTGNGDEAFVIEVTAESGVTVRGVAIDRDGDGRFDPARDTLLDGGVTPVVAAHGSLPLLVLADANQARVTVTAHARTGSGPAGTVFPGQGDSGGDAVTGATGARAESAVDVTGTAAGPTLIKSQSVAAPDGSARAVTGAVITYTLEASFPAAVESARIEDPVPAGTSFVPGSLRLDGAALADAAGFDGAAVAAVLGPQTAGSRRTLQFQVRIQ